MNRKTLFLLLAAGLVAIFTLAACAKGGDGEETGTGTGTGTTATTEAVTAIPRYDYMAAEVLPDVSVDASHYTDITLTIPNNLRVKDEDVQDYINYIRFQYRTAENGTATMTDKAVKLGDDVYIFYKGFIDGKEFEGGSNWDDESSYKLGLGSGSFIPGFEDALVGYVPADYSKSSPIEIKVTFPEDYGREELDGKEATFHVVIEYAVQYKMADYTKEFVLEDLEYETEKEFYASDKALFTEFEGFVRNNLESNMAQEIEYAQIDAIWNHLTEKVACKNLPEDEIAYYINSYKSEVEYYFESYTYSGGEEFAALYPDVATFAVAYMGLEKGADWEAEIRKMSELMVKKDMITHAIAELEGIESVTDEEYKAQVQYWVAQYQGYMTEADIISNMGEVALIEGAFADKMQAWLIDRFNFTYEDGEPLVKADAAEEESSEEKHDQDTEAAE